MSKTPLSGNPTTAPVVSQALRNTNLQDDFLGQLQEERAPLTVFLVNGVKLEGVVSQYDTQSFILTRDGHSQLVYKHSVSTIMPLNAVSLVERKCAQVKTPR